MSYTDLVSRLCDLRYLATEPEAGERSGAFTSGDRSSRYDDATDTYVEWHANQDGGGFHNPEDNTMLELNGPGVIWRIWSAQPEAGEIEFIVDGGEPWSIGFLDLFTTAPFTDYPELVHTKARGRNFYIPIPFQKSITVRAKEGWGKFYQFTYTTFPEGTKVPSWTGSLDEEACQALAAVNEAWGRRGPRLLVGSGEDSTSEEVALTLAPGASQTLAQYDEPGALVSILMDNPGFDRDASLDILRELTIAIAWDDDKSPAVWAPLGDFFGSAAGENRYRTLATGIVEEGYYCNWYMPYAKARIVITNDGSEARSLRFTLHREALKEGANELLRFHCKWHRDDFSGLDEERFWNDRWPDWPVVKIDGTAGRFCGFQAHMWNPNNIWSPIHRRNYTKPAPTRGVFADPESTQSIFYRDYVVGRRYWWGEGDEKFFVDGEAYPSTFGTGSEDYFGFAWGTSTAFDSPLQAQPRNGAADEIGKEAATGGDGNMGHIVCLRWQIPDQIPFTTGFEATIEKYHPNEWPLLNAYTAVWYQRPHKADYYGPVPVEERTGYYLEPTPKKPLPMVEGRLEGGEDEHIWRLKGHWAWFDFEDMSGKGQGWSQNQQWRLFFKLPDSTIDLGFMVVADAPSAVLSLTQGPDHAVIDVLIDGEPVATEVDCSAEILSPGLQVPLPAMSAGIHTLTLRHAGPEERRSKKWGGIDYLQLAGQEEG